MSLKSTNKIPWDAVLSSHIFCMTFIALLSFISYWNTLSNGFIWDDGVVIVENTAIRNLDLQTLIRFFTDKEVFVHAVGEIYRPLAILTYAIDYKLFGLDPFGYHLTNIILHTLNSILAFLVASIIFSTSYAKSKMETQKKLQHSTLNHQLIPALFTGILFAVHPIHTEAVGWIKDRDDLLALFFFLIAFHLYIKSGARSQRLEAEKVRGWRLEVGGKGLFNIPHSSILYPLSLVSFIFALLSKEMAITLPLILILFDLCFSPYKLNRIKNWVIYLPFFFISGAYFVARTIVLGQVAQADYLGGNFATAMYTISGGIVQYIKLLILPINLCADYSAFPISRTLNLTSTSLLITTLIIGVILYRFYKPAAFGIFWFFITLLPASNIVPLKIPIAERFLYIPSWGFVFLSGTLFGAIWMNIYTRVFKGILLFLMLSIVIFYTITTIERNRIWRDDFTFWSDVVKRCPSTRSFTNLGIELFERGQLDDAIIELRKAIANSKDFPIPHYHLGDAYTEKGWYGIARREYLIALELTEKEASAGKVNTKLTQKHKGYIMNSMGLLYMKQGLLNEATAYFNDAIRFRPEMMEAYYNLGLAYQRSGLPDDAIVAYYEALRIKPDYYDTRKKIAEIYVSKGLMEEASKILGQ